MASYLPDGVEDSLETRLNKATNPLLAEENWEYIVGFCDLINKDVDGPQIAVRLLVHKIQSPQEKESLFALTTLEACVRNCGPRFQQEIGKFRFINEIIKIVSPKYLGTQRTSRVKNRCIALLHFWSQILVEEPKIKEAYQMLKKQGLVKEDPDIYQLPSSGLGLTNVQPPPQPDTFSKNSIFEDEEKSKLLSRLLKSKNPDDLQAANRLIKNMVKQDAERTEKVTRRTQQLETVSNNVKLLNEMLQNYQPWNSTESDREIMKELSENIEKQRPALFRLASDFDERDSTGIGEILRANDEVIQVLSLYDSLINKSDIGNLLSIDDIEEMPCIGSAAITLSSEKSSTNDVSAWTSQCVNLSATPAISDDRNFVDEQLLLYGLSIKEHLDSNTTSSHPGVGKASASSEIDELSDIFSHPIIQKNISPPLIGETSIVMPQAFQQSSAFYQNHSVSLSGCKPSALIGQSTTSVDMLKPLSPSAVFIRPTISNACNNSSSISSSGLDTLDELSKSLLQETLSNSGLRPFQPAMNLTKITLNQMGKPNNDVSPENLMKINACLVKSLDDIFVPLETVKLGSKPSQTLYDDNDVVIIAHFASERPRSDILVIVLTVTSTSKVPIRDFLLHVTSKEYVLIKKQPASSSLLPAHNPILPPPAITQIILVACPSNLINTKLNLDILYLLGNNPVEAHSTISL